MKIAAPYAQVPYNFLTILIYHFVHNNLVYALSMVWKYIADIINYMQELLDLRQQRRTGTQLVNEIRRQADDVMQLNYLPLL